MENGNYWWININPKILRFKELDNGDIFRYYSVNEDGSERNVYKNFLEAREGDTVIAYEAEPAKEVVGICTIESEHENNYIRLKKVENLTENILRDTLEQNRDLINIEAFRNPQGTFFKLSENEYKKIYTIIREFNPLKKYRFFEKYGKEEFLEEVYFDESDYNELRNLVEKRKNVILQGAPGVGKTFIAKRMAYSIMGSKDEDRILNVQFYKDYSTEEFLEGFRPDSIGIYKYKKGYFKEFCSKARNDMTHKYFLLIDEINRGDIAKIFGETFMLIEPSKRGKENYVELSCSKERFYIPENLYIIGTMNMADKDKSISDYAVRRRFNFYTVKPIFKNTRFRENCNNNEMLKKLVNNIIDINEKLPEGMKIGHCYFCDGISDEELKFTVKYNLIPLVEEYFMNDERNKSEIIEKLQNSIFEK